MAKTGWCSIMTKKFLSSTNVTTGRPLMVSSQSTKKLKFQFFKGYGSTPITIRFFYVPIANFNIYDGITPGMRLYNKTFLERPFQYDISPTYSFLERTMVGKASFSYRKYHNQTYNL